jgi:kynurenine formamidase
MQMMSKLLALLLATGLICEAASAQQGAWFPSRFGAQDRLGAARNLSQAGALRALKSVRTGKVYSLAIVTGPHSPLLGDRAYSAEISTVGPLGPNQATGHDEKVITSMGIGTQIDGLGHVGIAHRYYNGLTEEEINTPEGFKKLDLSNLPPFVTRGIMLNMTKVMGRPIRAGDTYSSRDIKAALRAAGLHLRSGDVVLFYSGWMRMITSDKAKYAAEGPGLSEEGAEWLAKQGIVAVGTDAMSIDATPRASGKAGPAHQILLAKNGVYVLECVNTQALVEDGVTDFLFILAAPRFEGTTQLVVTPLAIR